jgi:hypothetical protein
VCTDGQCPEQFRRLATGAQEAPGEVFIEPVVARDAQGQLPRQRRIARFQGAGIEDIGQPIDLALRYPFEREPGDVPGIGWERSATVAGGASNCCPA